MDNIVELLKENNYTANEIASKLNLPLNETKKVLDELVDRLDLYTTRKGKYGLFINSKMYKGEITIFDTEGVVFVDGKEITIPTREIHGARNGDVVAIEQTGKIGSKIVGRVVKIKKTNKRVVGEVVRKGSKYYIKPDGDVDFKIVTPVTDLVDGTKVVLELDSKIDKDTYNSRVVEVIGHKDDPNVDVISVMKKYNVEIDFPEEVEAEMIDIPDTYDYENDPRKDEIIDLRDEKTFTIDGNSTKDYDDAISIKKIGDNYDLKVSIANVSNYVQPGMATFKDAMGRGTSIYVPGSNNPMLPRKLSNGICSLNPNVDRLVFTYEMLVSPEGEVLAFRCYDSVINSKKRMTYDDVNEILENGNIVEGYEDYVSDLKLCEELHHILRRIKIAKGYIDFEIPDEKVIVDDNYKPTDVVLEKRGTSEKLIEDFMVLAGEQASIYMDENNINHVYRVHEEPDLVKLIELNNLFHVLRYDGKVAKASGFEIQRLLKGAKEHKDYLIISREILKCMQRAIYSVVNKGHFASAIESNCQVTSPIRRGGDLANETQLRAYLYGCVRPLSLNELRVFALNLSSTERRAAKIEDEVKRSKKAEYMERFIGETFTGIITKVEKNGFYVELPNLIEGYVDRVYLTDDKYTFNPNIYALVGAHSKKKYALGDKIDVEVRGIDRTEGNIAFAISKEREKVKKYS